ncbi:LacI family DNA-binding transcriptional regulator [Sphaerimonospora mesophila]|uniref:LacI family DNA-binding transcriptional regulator n=1 Tax=Sphaerimonospora mesophila TaxID=37483 RepID=UPI0006E23545
MQARTHVTLEDVARAADVSLATASRALNGMRVTPHLRERVLLAAERLAYTPNAHARALAGGAHRTVGVVCHDVSDPYFAAIAGGVMRVAADNDLLVMLASTFSDPEREIAYVSMLRAERAHAILLIGSGFEDLHWERALEAELKPYLDGRGRVAVISRHRSLRVDTVLPENRAGAAAMARAMLEMGHRRFAVLTGPPVLTTVADRLGGFRAELRKAGVKLAAADIVEGPFTRDGGYAAMTRLLDQGTRATCVFAVADVMAIGACAAVRDRGLSVPDDVSVAGFDDIPIVRDLTPPLTTVALPLQQLGERALELALTENPERRRRVLRMGGEVVVRASTAKLT